MSWTTHIRICKRVKRMLQAGAGRLEVIRYVRMTTGKNYKDAAAFVELLKWELSQ